MERIAKAIGIVHQHGLVHGRIDTSAAMTEGGHQPDFLLGGFEWSLWFSAGEDDESHAKLSDQSSANRADKHYSFEDDWRSFGRLIADCLGLRIEASGDIILPEGVDASYVNFLGTSPSQETVRARAQGGERGDKWAARSAIFWRALHISEPSAMALSY
jgi:hypothetical protein